MTRRIKSKKRFSKKTRNILAISIILIVPFTFLAVSIAFSPFLTEGDLYLKSGDVIKNFKFDTVGGRPISLGGDAWNGKLQFEVGSTWDIQKDDVELISTIPVDDRVIYYYRISMTNKINIFTKVALNQGAENNQIKKVTETYEVANYRHSGLFGDRMFGWTSDIDWQHYDFGDIKTWNLMNNKFSGDVVMSFDINPSPLPATITDSEGNIVSKNFDYIAVSSATVLSNANGLLSDDMPSIIGIQPREYESQDLPLNKPTSSLGGNTKIYVGEWNPTIDLNIPRDPTNSFDAGIISHSVGAGMQPKTKAGGNVWNPSITQKSMTDAKFIYSLGSISPVVYEWKGTLGYNYKKVETTDYWAALFTLGVKIKSQTNARMYDTEPVALDVTNRYLQSKLKITFDVYSSFKVSTMDIRDDPDLEAPTQYFDSLLWDTIVDGFGGGQQYSDTGWSLFDLDSIIILVVIIIVVGGGIYVFMKIGVPTIRRRQQRKLIESAYNAGRRG